ncbi:MAG: threonylcarbamoyl-AMP synthase, partial [Ardenticatenia bacterium]|nr:threonylcarbamoyl-AMP synthase [Ardenticatenia bacterium]
GDSPGATPSPVVDLSTCPPRLLRTGVVAAHQLRRLLPGLIEVE